MNTEEPEILFTLKDSDMMEVISGKLDARRAFLMGKVKIIGNMALATKFLYILRKFKIKLDDVYEEMFDEKNINVTDSVD